MSQNGFWNSTAGYNYPSPYESRPAPTDWTVDKPDDAYATSPDSTLTFYTSSISGSWNYIDANGKQTIQPNSTSPESKAYEDSTFTYAQTTPESSRNPNWCQGNFQAANVSSFPVSPIQNPLARIEYLETDSAAEPVYPDSSFSTLSEESHPQSPGKAAWAAWETSKVSQQHSGSYISSKHSSLINEKERQNPRRRSSSSSSQGQWQLRGARTGPKIDFLKKKRPRIHKKHRIFEVISQYY